MKKPAIIISFLAIFFSMIVNIGELRCQDNSNMASEQYQSSYIEKINKVVSEGNLQDDKNVGVKILGCIIMHNLLCEYQGIDSKELEDRVEKSR